MFHDNFRESFKREIGERKEKSGYLFSNFYFLFSKNTRPLGKIKTDPIARRAL